MTERFTPAETPFVDALIEMAGAWRRTPGGYVSETSSGRKITIAEVEISHAEIGGEAGVVVEYYITGGAPGTDESGTIDSAAELERLLVDEVMPDSWDEGEDELDSDDY